MKFGQVSVEYLVILGLALFLLIPLINLFQTSSVNTQVLADSKQISLAGTEIIANAEKVYYQAKNSRIKMSLNFPANIDRVYISDENQSLVFEGNLNGVYTQFVFFSPVRLENETTGCNHDKFTPLENEGYKDIFVESCGKSVAIYAYEN